MAQSTFSVRMDESLKKQFDGLCLLKQGLQEKVQCRHLQLYEHRLKLMVFQV